MTVHFSLDPKLLIKTLKSQFNCNIDIWIGKWPSKRRAWFFHTIYFCQFGKFSLTRSSQWRSENKVSLVIINGTPLYLSSSLISNSIFSKLGQKSPMFRSEFVPQNFAFNSSEEADFGFIKQLFCQTSK